MKSFLVGVLGILLLSAGTLQAPAQELETGQEQKIDPEKVADIRRLLEVSGTKKLGLQMASRIMPQIFQIIRESLETSLSEQDDRTREMVDRFINNIGEKFREEFLTDYVKHTIPIYDKHLTHEEICGLVKFYESPLGQRVVEVMPKLMEDMMTMGQEWGEKRSQYVIKQALIETAEEFPELKGHIEEILSGNKN